MSNKTSKFLICENPMLIGANKRLFILHTRQPVIFAEVFHFNALHEHLIMEAKHQIKVGSSLDYGTETIIFEAELILPNDKFNTLNTQEQADSLAGIMRRMADWYKAYLIFEDSQIL